MEALYWNEIGKYQKEFDKLSGQIAITGEVEDLHSLLMVYCNKIAFEFYQNENVNTYETLKTSSKVKYLEDEEYDDSDYYTSPSEYYLGLVDAIEKNMSDNRINNVLVTIKKGFSGDIRGISYIAKKEKELISSAIDQMIDIVIENIMSGDIKNYKLDGDRRGKRVEPSTSGALLDY